MTRATSRNETIGDRADIVGVQDGDRVLEIGCGWGALGLRAAQKYSDLKWTGVTISSEQLAWGQRRVKELGLSDHVDLRLCDYR